MTYIYCAVLANDRGNIATKFGAVMADSQEEAAMYGLRLVQKANPNHTQIVGFDAVPITGTVADIRKPTT